MTLPPLSHRAMLVLPEHFVARTQLPAPETGGSPQQLLLYHGNELLVQQDGAAAFIPPVGYFNPTDTTATLVIGEYGGQVITASRLEPRLEPPEGAKWAGLRSLFGVLPDDWVAIAALGAQLLDWDRTHRYCGVCAAATTRDGHERARRCPKCSFTAYPRISPAMMCLVTRGDEILLARNVNFPLGRYSALAGFLEAGENIEDAVHREVMEEVGVEVGPPQYFASQSWPFPHSLMIAYTAEYAGGELRPNGVEIADAQWFNASNLPSLPPSLSIAGALIEHALSTRRGGKSIK